MTIDNINWDQRLVPIPETVFTGPRLPAAVALLAEWASSADAAYRLAQKLVTTSFVPQPFRGKPDEAAAAILAGAEVGLQPMAALRSFDIIQGIAAPRANTLRAIVQGHGHTVRLVESTDTRAIVEGWRLGQTKADAQRSTWTIDRATKLGLAGKENWKKQPGAMLVARATSELCRLIASDAILGVPYSLEELTDGVTVDESTGEIAEPTPKRTARRATLARVETPEPDLDPPADPLDEFHADTTSNPASVADEPLLSKAQNAAIHAHLNSLGISDRDEGLLFLSKAIGRDIESSKEIRKSEATTLLDEWMTPDAPAADLWAGGTE